MIDPLLYVTQKFSPFNEGEGLNFWNTYEKESIKKVSKYRKLISKFSFEPKNERKISALASKKLGQKFFVRFLVQMKTLKFAFDIY